MSDQLTLQSVGSTDASFGFGYERSSLSYTLTQKFTGSVAFAILTVRLVAFLLKSFYCNYLLETVSRSASARRTDGQTDRQTDGHTDTDDT